MARILQERQSSPAQQIRKETGRRQGSQLTAVRNDPSAGVQVLRQGTMPDVDMESVGACEFDPDDLDLEGPFARMANAAMGQGPNLVPRIKLSATSDLKESTEKIKTRTEHAAGGPQ